MKECMMTEHAQNRVTVRDHARQPVTLGDALAVALLLITSAALGALVFYDMPVMAR